MAQVRPTSHLLNTLRFRQVALVLAIQEYGTLRAAADSLGMTQPSATQMLHELEDAFGEVLFDRVKRRLQINPAGQAVMNAFRNLRNNMTALAHELHELHLGSEGKFVVGCIMAAIPTHLTRVLVGLRKRYPLLSIEIIVDSSDRLVDQLRLGSIDVAIGRLPRSTGPEEKDCLFKAVGHENMSVIVSAKHPLVRLSMKANLRFEDLLGYPWILQQRGSPSREVIEQEFLGQNAKLPRGLIETTSILAAIDLLSLEDMISILPYSIASIYETKFQAVKILPYSFTHRLTPWGSIIHRDRSITPVMNEFLELLHARNGSGRRGNSAKSDPASAASKLKRPLRMNQ